MQSVAPKEAAIWITDKRDALGDPAFRASPRTRRGLRLVPGRPTPHRTGRPHPAVARHPVCHVHEWSETDRGSGHRPPGHGVDRRNIAGLGPTHRDRPATQGGRVNGGPAATALVARRRNGRSPRGVSGLGRPRPRPESEPRVSATLRATWPTHTSTPLSEHNSSICSTSSVPTHRRSSSRGRPAISLRTSSSASTILLQGRGSSFLAHGAASLNDEEARSRRATSHGLSRRSERDRRRASSASSGCAGSRTSTSSSSTTRTYAEPTVAVPARTSRRWTTPSGATSVMGAGFSPADYVVQDSRCSGREPPTPFERGGGIPPPASSDLRASCCSISSGPRRSPGRGGRARRGARSGPTSAVRHVAVGRQDTPYDILDRTEVVVDAGPIRDSPRWRREITRCRLSSARSAARAGVIDDRSPAPGSPIRGFEVTPA